MCPTPAPKRNDTNSFEGVPALGRRPGQIVALYHRAPTSEVGLLEHTDALRCALTVGGHMTLDAAIVVVMSALAAPTERQRYSEQTLRALGGDLARFARYLSVVRGQDVEVGDVTRADVIAWIEAPILTGDGACRASSTQVRARRHWALDVCFAQLRALAVVTIDPLRDVPRAHRDACPYRPLRDAEVARARFRAGRDRHDTRGPAVWALAEATATTSEIPEVTIADVDLERSVVWLTGGARNVARWAVLTPWGGEALARHIAALGEVPASTPLIYRGTSGPVSGQASASRALHEILTRARLGDDPTARPLSIAAWRGRQLFEECGDLETVRHALGLRSLDRARDIIGAPMGCCDVPPAHRAEVAS